MSEQSKPREWTISKAFPVYKPDGNLLYAGYHDIKGTETSAVVVIEKSHFDALSARNAELEQRLRIIYTRESTNAVPDSGIKLEMLNHEIDSLRARNAELQESRDSWKRNADARWDGLVGYEKEIDSLRAQLAELQSENAQLLKQEKHAVTVAEKCMAENCEIKHRLYDLSNVELKLKAAVRERDEVRKVLAEKDANLKSANEKLADLQAAMAFVNSKLGPVTEAYRNLEAENKNLREALVKQQEVLECLGEKFDPSWSLKMAETGVRGVALTSLAELREILARTNKLPGGET